MTVTTSTVRSPVTPVWKCYLELTKPKIVALVAFTALVGALLARPGLPPAGVLGCAILGIALSAQCAAVLNHVFDRHIDERMTRTRRRPLPTLRVTEKQAMVFLTSVALENGFLHLPRFSSYYRAAYGETPVATLRRNRHDAPP